MFLQVEGAGVDAVAQAGLVARAIIKDMPQMRIAAIADHLDAPHAVAAVFMQRDIAIIDDIPKAGPAAHGVVLGHRGEQLLAAGGAGIDAGGFAVDVLAAEGALGRLLAQDGILFRAELAAPFRLALFDLFTLHVAPPFRFMA